MELWVIDHKEFKNHDPEAPLTIIVAIIPGGGLTIGFYVIS